ncbi:TolC family protein [Chryseobacterium salipaludis]|uniref:TolC family protein n=1 Tax=Chryseobacterium TaxID=59732 RepID=UPI001FF2C1C7|nr:MULTISPECIES: TolC family protein [Chryseobacterium]MCJ8496650.1 TolC family protein [Chryseobacterium salipaludis]MCX3296131.1 TolC family protein [Planobacterium sp. JC490]
MKKLIFSLVFASSFLFAQERVLTLPEAIEYALQHKADAEKARLDIRKGEAEIAEVKSNAYPNITVNSSTTYNPLVQESLLPGEIFGAPGQQIKVAFGQKWTSSNMVQLTQNIFNQQVFVGLKAARSTQEFYIINAQLTEEQIIEKVANAYFQVYQAEQMLNNAESNLKITNETIKIIKGLFDAGLSRKIDYDRVVVARNNIVSSQKQLQNAVELSENALKFMIGMPIAEEISLPEQTFEPSFLADRSADFAARTEVKLLNKQIELLNWKKKASEAEYYPTVALSANYGFLGQGEKFPLFYGEKNGVFWSDLASIGLNIRIPVFNGFATKARVELNSIEIEKAQADLRETTLGLDLAYHNAIAQLENNETTIGMQEENVKLAEEVLSNTRSNYQYGLATLNDILDAERDLTEAKNNLTRAQLDYKLAEIDLLKSQGKLRTLSEINY